MCRPGVPSGCSGLGAHLSERVLPQDRVPIILPLAREFWEVSSDDEASETLPVVPPRDDDESTQSTQETVIEADSPEPLFDLAL